MSDFDGMGAIVSRYFVSVPTGYTPPPAINYIAPLSLPYNYYLRLQETDSANNLLFDVVVANYYETFPDKVLPAGYALPEITLAQALEIEEAALAILKSGTYKVSAEEAASYEAMNVQPLRDAIANASQPVIPSIEVPIELPIEDLTSVPEIITYEGSLSPESVEAIEEMFSSETIVTEEAAPAPEVVVLATTTNVQSDYVASQPLTAKLADFLEHPLAQLLRR